MLGVDWKFVFDYGSIMSMKSIAAHFDGHQICLDEPVDLLPHTRLLVTILEDDDLERAGFLALAGTVFADSFGDDEVEYNETDLK